MVDDRVASLPVPSNPWNQAISAWFEPCEMGGTGLEASCKWAPRLALGPHGDRTRLHTSRVSLVGCEGCGHASG
jgi:hypothetical protein